MDNSHPLGGVEIQGVSIKCFDKDGSGFFHFAPISIVIGKNNSGKSSVLDLLQAALNSADRNKGFVPASQQRSNEAPAIDYRFLLSEDDIRERFPGDHGNAYGSGLCEFEFGRQFLEYPVTHRISGHQNDNLLSNAVLDKTNRNYINNVTNQINRNLSWTLNGRILLRVAAERRVVPELSKDPPEPSPNGDGITNLIRYFINNDAQPRDLVEVNLLSDLNQIYLGDSEFTSIICQEGTSRPWEIFLREKDKGDVRLSESGSSLQSIFIMLAYFRLVPKIQSISWNDLIFAIEEPENNLHPALLRRLMEFLAEKREELGFSLVLTTHSPISIDWATRRGDTCIVHVSKSANRTVCKNVMDYGDKVGILDDLDVRGSDILQSNGIIWVEGPSDRVYLRRWIDIITNNSIVEGSHYTFMYYGGKVLSHFQAVPASELSTLISMVTTNRNAAILMDSDRKRNPNSGRLPPMKIGKTKLRLKQEIERNGGLSWITAGKEIENYTPPSVWQKLTGVSLRIRDEFESIPEINAIRAIASTKVELAHKVSRVIELDDIKNSLDLDSKLSSLISHIKRWSSMN